MIREIADSLHRFEKISFPDDKHLNAIGRINDCPKSINEYDCAVVAI